MDPIPARRTALVADCLADIRARLAADGLSRDTLEAVKARLIDLARQDGVFAPEDFPPPEDGDRTYLLNEDEDHGFALYVVSGRKGKRTPPHDHTTWAVIAGIAGEEVNRLYRRTDDGRTPGRGTLEQVNEVTVRPGTGLALMPDDIHSIAIDQDRPSLFLHLYGRALDQLPERVCYDLDAGTYEVFPAHPDIVRLPAP